MLICWFRSSRTLNLLDHFTSFSTQKIKLNRTKQVPVYNSLIFTCSHFSLYCQGFFIIIDSVNGVCWYTPPGSRPPRSRHPQEQTPLLGADTAPGAEHAGRYGQRAGGTHPTGMQSCF